MVFLCRSSRQLDYITTALNTLSIAFLKIILNKSN